MLVKSNWLKLIITLLLLAGAAYIVIRVQSRSGILVFSGGIVMAVFFHFISKHGNKTGMIILAVIAVIFAYKLVPFLYQIFEPLFIRFVSEGTEKGTAEARLSGMLEVFSLLQDPANWVPRGNPESLTGHNKSHSNITAILLESGLLGLIAWMGLFVYPIVKLIKKYIEGIDAYILVAFVAGVMSLVLQMTLNVPVMDQVWLWAGATNGAIKRSSVMLQHKFQINKAQ